MDRQQIETSISNLQANIEKAQASWNTRRVQTLQQNLETRQRQLSELWPSPSQPTQQSQSNSSPIVQQGTEIRDNQGNLVRPDLLQQSEYSDDSDTRQQGIIANLNQAAQNNTSSLRDYNTFRTFYNYQWRSDAQRQTLDNWYFWYDEGRTLSQQTARSLADQYSAWAITQSQLQNLQIFDAGKYDATMQMINQWAILSWYNNQLNPKKNENPFQGIIDNLTQNLQTFSQAPQFYDEYKEAINSGEMKEAMDTINDYTQQIETIDEQLNNIKKDVEKRYEWSGTTNAKISAIIADEGYELTRQKNNLAIQMNSEVNKYNSRMQTLQQDMQLRMQDYQLSQQAQQMQMQQVGMLMNLMSFETPQQQDERQWNNFIRQQEYQEWNIYSNDPATRRKAVSNAVDNVLKEFAGIPMIRSREQMIQDIQNMVDNGTDLGTAITDNIRKPIMDKPEYKSRLRQQFPPEIVTIWWLPYSYDDNGNLVAPTFSWPWTWVFTAEDLWRPAGSKNVWADTNNYGNFVNGTGAGNIGTYKSSNGRTYSVFATAEDWYNALIQDIETKQSWWSAYLNWNSTMEDLLWVRVNWKAWSIDKSSSYYKAATSIVSWNTKIWSVSSKKIAEAIMKWEWTRQAYLNWWVDLTHLGTGDVWWWAPTASEQFYYNNNAIDPKGEKWLTPKRYNEVDARMNAQRGSLAWADPQELYKNLFSNVTAQTAFEKYFENNGSVASMRPAQSDRQQNLKELWLSSTTEFEAAAKAWRSTQPPDVRTVDLLDRLDTLDKAIAWWIRSSNVIINPDTKAHYNFIKKNLTLDTLQAAKKQGATFGSMSDAERDILAQAATSLSPLLSKTAFRSELQRIRNQIYENYPSLRWTSNMSYVSQTDYDNIRQQILQSYWINTITNPILNPLLD